MTSLDSPRTVARAVKPPSRDVNPFATCWTRPGALVFRFTAHESAEGLVSRLASQCWWGAIVGPHGSGKSTLLETLKPVLAAAGRQVHAVTLHDGDRRVPQLAYDALAAKDSLLIIDGYEQLGWLEQRRLIRRCRRTQAGLLVTAHRPTPVPTLLCLAPDRTLVGQLVAELCAEVSTSITKEHVDASHARHGCNVREIFFDLYSQHERGRRQSVG